jgi:hypothetical protein
MFLSTVKRRGGWERLVSAWDVYVIDLNYVMAR